MRVRNRFPLDPIFLFLKYGLINYIEVMQDVLCNHEVFKKIK